MPVMQLPLTQFLLLLFRKVIDFPAFGAATAIIFGSTLCALYKQKMASAVFAVGMGIGRLAALVTMGNYFS
jgi:hypothetical protein